MLTLESWRFPVLETIKKIKKNSEQVSEKLIPKSAENEIKTKKGDTLNYITLHYILFYQDITWRAWAIVAWDSVSGLCFEFTTVKLQGPNKSLNHKKLSSLHWWGMKGLSTSTNFETEFLHTWPIVKSIQPRGIFRPGLLDQGKYFKNQVKNFMLWIWSKDFSYCQIIINFV